MSTNYYTKIFLKEKDGYKYLAEGWTNQFKNICNYDLDSFYTDDEFLLSHTTYTTYDYEGVINVNDIDDTLCVKSDKYFVKDNFDYDKIIQVINTNKTTIFPKNYIDCENVHELDNKEKYVDVYKEKEESRYGNFYNYSTFSDLEKKLKKSLDEVVRHKEEYKRLTSSIDYLKLSFEEKENVDASFEYDDESIKDFEYSLNACTFFESLISWYCDGLLGVSKDYHDYSDIVLYIYHE